jgi:hypothetical protein
MQKNDNDINKRRKADRAAALLALAAQPGKSPGPCPDTADLILLTENRLQEEERKKIFTHIDGCPDCFEKWLMLSSDKFEDKTEKKTHSGKVIKYREKTEEKASTGRAMWHNALSSWQFKSAVGFAFVVCLITPFYLSLNQPATIVTDRLALESDQETSTTRGDNVPPDSTIYHKLFIKGYRAPIDKLLSFSDLGGRSPASSHSAPSKDTVDNQFYQAGQIGRKILIKCKSEDTHIEYVSPKELKIIQAMRDQAPASMQLFNQYIEEVEHLAHNTNPDEQKDSCSKLEDIIYTLLKKGF